jgi:hypothetical protein
LPRKLIAADDQLVAKLMAISNQEGKTFYAFVNEVFQEVLRVRNRGRTLQEIIDFYELMETQRISGAVLTPMDALDFLVSNLGEDGRKRLEDIWYEAGRWYGKYLASRFPNGTLEALGRLLTLSRGELTEVQVAPGDPVRVRCASPLISMEYTRLLKRYVEGAVHSLDYETSREECLKGLIILELRPRSGGRR